MPFKVSMGVAYSSIQYTFGILTTSPYIITQTDFLNNLTLGIGLKYLVTLSLGYTLSPITARTEIGNNLTTQSTSAHGIGAILQIPVVRVVSQLTNHAVLIPGRVKPTFDFRFDYSRAAGGPFQGEPFETLNVVVR
ncbi:MAG: hypothetical protein M1469_00040 [Bacteroidetes bacterium]|nr:hypothetical protein [Bacteroidota bacterium]